jgi:hypothetical protein
MMWQVDKRKIIFSNTLPVQAQCPGMIVCSGSFGTQVPRLEEAALDSYAVTPSVCVLHF